MSQVSSPGFEGLHIPWPLVEVLEMGHRLRGAPCHQD